MVVIINFYFQCDFYFFYLQFQSVSYFLINKLLMTPAIFLKQRLQLRQLEMSVYEEFDFK